MRLKNELFRCILSAVIANNMRNLGIKLLYIEFYLYYCDKIRKALYDTRTQNKEFPFI